MQYPHVKEMPTDRARGVIALHEENCTACMLCARECPDWCIYIEGHKYLAPPRREGGKPRQKNALDRFDIDYALCMYCGICVEVCPFEALFWTPEYEYSEPRIADLAPRQRAPQRVDGHRARLRALRGRFRAEGVEGSPVIAEHVAFGIIAAVMVASALRVVTTRDIVHAALYLVIVLAGVAALFLLVGAEFTGITQVLIYIGAVIVLFLFGIMLTRSDFDQDEETDHKRKFPAILTALLLAAVMIGALVDRFEDVELDATPQTTAQVSDELFSQYIVPFEAVSVLLLAALIGAIVIARREEGG